jgi:hypothetical protein
MTLFHFEKSLVALKHAISSSRTLGSALDAQRLRAASRTFRDKFPDIGAARHAVAHQAELRATQKKRDENNIDGDAEAEGFVLKGAKGAFVSEMLNGRSFSNTFEGALVTHDISWENHQTLRSVIQEIVSVFTDAAEKIKGGGV